MFSNCQGQTSQGNISMHNQSHSSQNFGHLQQARGNFFTSCLQAVCGLDPSTSAGRKYSTTMDDNSSITALTQHNLNFEDECHIISLNRFTKRVQGRDVRYIQAQVALFDDEVDEAHDLFYLVEMPENLPTNSRDAHPSSPQPSNRVLQSQLQHRGSFSNNGIQLPEQPTGKNSSHGRDYGPLSPSDISQKQPSGNALQSLNRRSQIAAALTGAAQQSSTGGPADFINQNTGSFTFHPQQDQGNKSFTGTHSSSQPNLERQIGNAGGVENFAINIQLQENETVRCDTDTLQHQQQQEPHMYDMLKPNAAASSQRNIEYGASSTSSLLLQDGRHGQQVAMASGKRLMPRLPRTYGDLVANYTVQVKKDKQNGLSNVAIGQFPLSKVPDGKYRIYYFRPKNRNRLIGGQTNSSSAMDKIQRVGKGQEFYIFDKNSSQSPSKHSISSQPSFDLRHQQSSAMSNSRTARQHEDYSDDMSSGLKVRKRIALKNNQVVPDSNKELGRKVTRAAKKGLTQPRPSGNHESMNYASISGQNQINQNENAADFSPDEFDALVVRPDSTSLSKDSFNTDKIRKENLGQNFGNALRGNEINQNQQYSGVCESGLTFGANSAAISNHVLAASGSQNQIQASDTLSGLQEIYSVHQVNLAQGVDETIKLHSIKTGGDCEQADTPNLYHTMSMASQHTVSIDDKTSPVQSQFQAGSTGQLIPNDHEEISHNTAADTVGRFSPLSQGNTNINYLKGGKKGGKFVIRLNPMEQHKTPDQSGLIESDSKKDLFTASDKKNDAAAIRVEKQISYSHSPSDSSSSAFLSKQPSSNKDLSPQDQIYSQNLQGVLNAFTAAEIKVRKSQIQMFSCSNKNNNNEGISNDSGKNSCDYVTQSSEASITNKIQAHQTQGPPIIVASHTQNEVDQMLTEVVLQPNFSRRIVDPQNGKQEMEQDIKFLQQLIDTSGPSVGPNNMMIKVMPLNIAGANNVNGNKNFVSDQSLMAQLGYSSGPVAIHGGHQKHSRAIAYQDNGDHPQSSDQQQQHIQMMQCHQSISIAEETSILEQEGEDDQEPLQFQSPETAESYREMIRMSNTQNGGNANNFEQLTRNTNQANSGSSDCNQQKVMQTAPQGYSDKKQLSTVEEENASQCSDMTSMQYHHSKFMQTQQSAKSRKSLTRNSQQAATTHHQNSNQKATGSFCISEEPSETDIGDQAIEVEDVDVASQIYVNDKRSSIRQQSIEPSQNTTDSKMRINVPGSSDNISANSTNICSKQLSSVLQNPSTINTMTMKEGQFITGLQSLKIENKPSRKSELLNSSDYYSLNNHNTNQQHLLQQPQSDRLVRDKNGGQNSNRFDETSSSLLDLDSNDFNLTSQNITPGQTNKESFRTLTDEQRVKDGHHSFIHSSQQNNNVQLKVDPVSNFKNKINPKKTDENFDIFECEERAKSADSESIDSVDLNCSENFQKEIEPKDRKDSQALIQMIDNLQLNPEQPLSAQKSENLKSDAQTKSSSNVKSSGAKGTSKKNSANSMKRKQKNIFINNGTGIDSKGGSIKNGLQIAKTQSQSSYKENTLFVGSDREQPAFARNQIKKSSMKHLTPILDKSSNIQALKPHQLVQHQVMSPNIGLSCRKKKLELNNSERKLVFVPLGTQASQSSPQLTLFAQNSATVQGNQFSPPQPLIKSKELFVAKNVAAQQNSQYLQKTTAQHKLNKKYGLHTGSSSKKNLIVNHQASADSKHHVDSQGSQKTLTKLLLNNVRSK